MSCGNNYNGWGGGCGCENTVQYAPPACNPNFPTYCTALNDGNIVRLVGEDSSFCKYTVPTFTATATNTKAQSILTYNNVGNVSWGDGSSSKPIYIAPPDNTATGQAYQSPVYGTTGVSLQATTATGQLVELAPASSLLSKAQFPVVAPSGSTTTWGTIDNIIPNDGVVYRSSGTVAEATLGSAGQVLTMVSGVPTFATPNTPAFIDSQSISLVYNTANSILVSYGSLVLTNFATGAQIVKSGSGATYQLNINTATGAGSMDTAVTTASNYYYVYAIYNSATSSFSVVGSSQSSQPSQTNLGGYGGATGYYRLIGVFYSGFNNQISSYYTQYGRNVYFGLTDQPQSSPTLNASTYVFFGGQVTGLPPASIASKATLLLSALNQPVNQYITCAVSNSYGTSGTTRTWVAYNQEVYGSCTVAGIAANSSNYANFDVPVAGSFGYNINLAVAQGTTNSPLIQLTVAGCTLSIF